MKQVDCEFTRQTGIKVLTDCRLPRDRVGICALVTKQSPGPNGTKVVHELHVQSVAISGRPS